MLILSRMQDEGITISDLETGEILARIVVMQVSRGRVKLGLDSDRRYKIMRDEIIDLEPRK